MLAIIMSENDQFVVCKEAQMQWESGLIMAKLMCILHRSFF